MHPISRIAFWAAAVFAFVMAVLPQPVELPASDKVQHMAAFFTIGLLGCVAYPRLSRGKLLLALVAFGGLIELVQIIPALHRDSQWSDWMADIAAAIGALVVVFVGERFRSARSD